MDCSEVKDKLQLYMEEENKEHPDIEKHLKDCPDCREELSGYRDLRKELDDIPQVRVSEGFTQRVMSSVRAKEKEGIKSAIAAAVVMFILSFTALGVGLRGFFSDPGSFVKMPVITKNILAGSLTFLVFAFKTLISVQNFILMTLSKIILISGEVPVTVWFIVPLVLLIIDALAFRMAMRKGI